MQPSQPKRIFTLCGQEIAQLCALKVDQALQYRIIREDGSQIKKGEVIAELSGPLASILASERVSLNFLQHLSGIASYTKEFADLARKNGTRIRDTRKTIPAWRELQKYAVKVGGGLNHRFGLYDAILIKDNHLDASSTSIAKAVAVCREKFPEDLIVEVEVRDFSELQQALQTDCDEIMLDNWSASDLPAAIAELDKTGRKDDIKLEVSGKITRESIEDYLVPGVDYIALGAITHSAPAVDISVNIC